MTVGQHWRSLTRTISLLFVRLSLCLYGCSYLDDVTHCKTGGQGVITAATFAMLFGLLAMFFLHVDVAGKQLCGKAIRFPRTFLFLFDFLSLTLYIVTVATWYNQCYNRLSGFYLTVNGSTSNSNGLTIGYAVATAIAAIVFEFLAWVFAFWRTCSPNKNEAVRAPASGSASGIDAPAVLSPTGSSVPYTQQASSSNLGKAAIDEQPEGNAYGGSSYGNGNAYSNGSAGAYGGNDDAYSNDATAGGYTSGGYGAGGGAYTSNKQESAYGY